MPFDMPLVLRKTANGVCARTLVRDFTAAAPAQAVASGVAQNPAVGMRPIEPMLLLHQEQARTFRLIAEAVGRGFRALTRSVQA